MSEATRFRDYRRAALLVRYRRVNDPAGVATIVAETNDDGRSRQLLLAILGLNRSFVVQLRTEAGVALLADYVDGLTRTEALDESHIDRRRAANIISSYMTGNIAGVDMEMNAASEGGRVDPTLCNILNIFDIALPELSSSAGLQWQQSHVDALVAHEYGLVADDL